MSNKYLDKVNDVLSRKTKSTEILNENNLELSNTQKDSEKKQSKKVFQRIFEHSKK